MDLSSDSRTDPYNFLNLMQEMSTRSTQQALQASARRNALTRRASGGPSVGPGPGPSGGPASGDLQSYAQQQLARYGWGGDQWGSLQQLWNRESGWNPNAVNPSSGAFGIAQILPSAHPDVPRNLSGQQQIDWGLNYIKDRYGNPASAWSHSQQTNWY